MRDEVYDAKIEDLKAKYEPRILALLNEAAAVFRAAGFACDDADDMADEEYSWFFTAVGTAKVGVTFTEEQKTQIKALAKSGDALGAQKIILQELNSEFGGSAEAQATALGKAKV